MHIIRGKGSGVSCVSEQSEKPPIEHFLELQAGGRPSGALLTALQVSPVRDLTAMFPTEDPTLATHYSELSSDLEEDIDVQQIAGEIATGPAKGESLLSEVKWETHVSTFSSRLFLRRGNKVVVLSEGRFLDGLEEFEKLLLIE